MFHKLRKPSESSRLVRSHGKTGSLPFLSPAGTLRFEEVVQQSVMPATLFVFVLLLRTAKWRFDDEPTFLFLTQLGVVLLMAWPAVAFFVYAAGIWQTIRNSVARSSAVVFWLFWPFFRFVICITAVVCAWTIADHLWFNNFRLYIQYHRLQAYDNVDAYTVTGNRMQDAGLVVFNESNGVDRSKAGCVVNGHTYCIAPIIRGGAVNTSKQSRSDVNDLFMAGIDCCNCPVTDFRCGDWDDSVGKLGGMRIFDEEERKMFRLATDKWGVDYHKAMEHPIFFKWVNDPIVAWKALWTRGNQLAFLAAIFGVLGSFLVNMVLNGFMKLLRDLQFAAPLDGNVPMLPGIGWGPMPDRKSFMPDEYRSYLSQQEPTTSEKDPQYVVL